MNTDHLSPSTLQNRPEKARSYRWVWLLGISGLCICIVGTVVVVAIFISQSPLQTDITTGKLDGTLYTNSDESFTCDFKDFITPDIWITDPMENNVGKVDLYNTVTSVNITIQFLTADEVVRSLLDDPDKYQEGISTQAQRINDDFTNRFPNSERLVSEFADKENIFTALIVPDSRYSYFDNPTSDLDLLLGILLFAKSHYVYVIQTGFPLNAELQGMSKDNQIDYVRTRVKDVYQICTFNR